MRQLILISSAHDVHIMWQGNFRSVQFVGASLGRADNNYHFVCCAGGGLRFDYIVVVRKKSETGNIYWLSFRVSLGSLYKRNNEVGKNHTECFGNLS